MLRISHILSQNELSNHSEVPRYPPRSTPSRTSLSIRHDVRAVFGETDGVVAGLFAQ